MPTDMLAPRIIIFSIKVITVILIIVIAKEITLVLPKNQVVVADATVW